MTFPPHTVLTSLPRHPPSTSGISRDSLHKRRATGGKQKPWRKKRKCVLPPRPIEPRVRAFYRRTTGERVLGSRRFRAYCRTRVYARRPRRRPPRRDASDVLMPATSQHADRLLSSPSSGTSSAVSPPTPSSRRPPTSASCAAVAATRSSARSAWTPVTSPGAPRTPLTRLVSSTSTTTPPTTSWCVPASGRVAPSPRRTGAARRSGSAKMPEPGKSSSRAHGGPSLLARFAPRLSGALTFSSSRALRYFIV